MMAHKHKFPQAFERVPLDQPLTHFKKLKNVHATILHGNAPLENGNAPRMIDRKAASENTQEDLYDLHVSVTPALSIQKTYAKPHFQLDFTAEHFSIKANQKGPLLTKAGMKLCRGYAIYVDGET